MASFIIGLMLLLVIPLVPAANAQTQKNLTIGSSVTAGDPNTYLLSPSGHFAFGFQKIGSGFLLAIWFDKTVNKTIVWSANGDRLAPAGSEVRLMNDSCLLLNDLQGEEIWSVRGNSSSFAYASMLDIGNLVLASQDHSVSWDTFSHPTDTILPTQILSGESRLVARYSETNYSGGRFALVMKADGYLKLFTIHYPSDSLNSEYWSNGSGSPGSKLIFNRTGQVYLTASNGTITWMMQSSANSTDEFYQRAIIEHDGVFRQYTYPKMVTSGTGRPAAWSMVSTPVPSNICLDLRQDMGSGACGFNSYCTLGNDQRPTCTCPNGYVMFDPNDETKGCKPDFAPQSCDKNKPEEDKFFLKEMANTDWPLSDYEEYQGQSEAWCGQACLADCFCAVAIYRGSTCWKKKFPLSNGRMDDTVGGKAFIKRRIANSTTGFTGNRQKTKSDLPILIIGSGLLGGSAFFNLLLLVLTCLICRRLQSEKESSVQQPHLVKEASGLTHFTYQELRDATDGFKEELGRGAFGAVYKGFVRFPSGDGSRFVAVKVLHKLTDKGLNEFKSEMRAICRTNHKNLVKLLGYCNEDQHRILVYEYMSNSCVANLLFGGSRPSWYKRIEIAQGIANGLSYLHEECGVQIIHCDIKPRNVLLDDSLRAKISDFGLAKLLMTDQTRTLTQLRGTKGYVAPEWFRNMPISTKVDVYSFGILLLELICCRKNYEEGADDEAEMILVDWVYDHHREGNLASLVKHDAEALGDKKRFERFVRTALWCIQEDPSLRPTMRKVTLMLEGAAPVPVPPDPCSFISSIG